MSDRHSCLIADCERTVARAYRVVPDEKREMLARMRANPLPEPRTDETPAEYNIRLMQAWYRTLTPTDLSYLSAEWKSLFGIADA